MRLRGAPSRWLSDGTHLAPGLRGGGEGVRAATAPQGQPEARKTGELLGFRPPPRQEGCATVRVPGQEGGADSCPNGRSAPWGVSSLPSLGRRGDGATGTPV